MKLGIALEGGGARGAYQVGAWRALEEAGIRYNAVSGTSVGAIIADWNPFLNTAYIAQAATTVFPLPTSP